MADINASVPLDPGTSLTLTCTAVIGDAVNVSLAVAMGWRRNGSSLSSLASPATSVTDLQQTAIPNGTVYERTLVINPLLAGEDGGEYTCTVTVSSGESLVDPVTTTSGLNITVRCKSLVNM